MVSEDKLGCVIADVSGKGIPAALFMMVSKSMIKNYALAGLLVSEVLSKANNALCENNDANMFVTVFMSILDLKTGKLSYSNAGFRIQRTETVGRTEKKYEPRPNKTIRFSRHTKKGIYVYINISGIMYKKFGLE
ncbi:MAG: PP2C family protein-serine/threonine phosphatase [Bacillota bacterium]|nr:PP2C family protein-serine/threonine phosphatase [Bacillota bacterium]